MSHLSREDKRVVKSAKEYLDLLLVVDDPFPDFERLQRMVVASYKKAMLDLPKSLQRGRCIVIISRFGLNCGYRESFIVDEYQAKAGRLLRLCQYRVCNYAYVALRRSVAVPRSYGCHGTVRNRCTL